MQKRWLLPGIGVILIVLIIIIAFAVNRINLPCRAKGSESASLSAKALQSLEKGNLPSAKEIYQQLISEFPNSPEVIDWQKKIEEINIKLLFSQAPSPRSVLYEVKAGDTLDGIAREFKTTVDLIKASNGLSDDKILVGRKLRVWNAPFAILVDKSQNTLILKTDEEVLKTYIVSTGANNSTPTGTFKIVNRLIYPTWFKAGAVVPPESPENILGSRWLGFDLPGYGLHGTTQPESLGKQVTQGCVRMSNADIEQLYTIIPIGTEVTIVD